MHPTKRTVAPAVAAVAAAAALSLVAACDLTVGPPTQDIGYEHNVGPAKAPTTVAPEPPPGAGP